jgi:hypothetical protein
MIKQDWNISLDERVRILYLHENATKNLYRLSEQTSPVSGPGNQNTVLDQDENYIYVISQALDSVQGDYIVWTKPYFVYALTPEVNYQCKITSKDEKGRPTAVEVLKDKPLPDLTKNEFQFAMVKPSKKESQSYYEFGNEITKNAFFYRGVQSTGVLEDNRYFAVTWYNGRAITVKVTQEGPTLRWTFENQDTINFNDLEVGSKTLFNPVKDVFVTNKGAYFSLIVPTIYTSYPVSIGKSQPEKPNEIPPKKTPPPQPVPLGDKFMDNVSMPTADDILKDPKFIEFKKFVEGNDMSKFIFDIQSSASKCSAGFKESNKSNGKWSEDKSTYPDVTVDPQADKNDLGNLNLTKARAQNLKNFLITNLPNLKNAKFRVIAQGSKGTCGTEEENQKLRRVDLTVTQL